MYYEIEGLYEMPSVIFDEDRLVQGDREYLYEKIDSIKITNSIAFSAYAILQFDYEGKLVSVPFNRHHIKVVRHALKEWKQLKQGKQTKGNSTKESPKEVPYEAIKQLKELYDMGALTEEEFTEKKKQLLEL